MEVQIFQSHSSSVNFQIGLWYETKYQIGQCFNKHLYMHAYMLLYLNRAWLPEMISNQKKTSYIPMAKIRNQVSENFILQQA